MCFNQRTLDYKLPIAGMRHLKKKKDEQMFSLMTLAIPILISRLNEETK